MEIRGEDSEDFIRTQQSTNNSPRRRKSDPKMGFWQQTVFQRIFIKCLLRLIIYLYKLYEDVGAVNVYYRENAFLFEIVSVLCLVIPSLVFAVYQSLAEFIKKDIVEIKIVITKFVHGLLLIPWQIKRHLDGLYFASQNLFLLREPRPEEKENLAFLNHNAETLEFFEDLYAGFIQVVLQVYILSIETQNKFLLIVGEIVGSALSILSMLVAVKRRDDGWFTGALSFIGWVSMFTSRVMVFALISTIIGAWTILLCMIHVLGFTYWVYRIAEKSNQRADTNKKRRGITLMVLCFFLFGIPSLVLWPYMFELKEKGRPQKFLLIILIENSALLLIWWFFRQTENKHELYWLMGVVAATLIAIIFLSFYFCCKPALTDRVVLHDMRYTETESFGIYFEFCDLVFNLVPDAKHTEILEIIDRDPQLTAPTANRTNTSSR